jgi:uncharacterized integral membrane protein
MSTEGDKRPTTRDRRRDARLVATGILAVLLVWFAIGNRQDVEIHFWVHTTRAPMIVVVAVAIALGAGVLLLISRFTRRRPSHDD